MAFPINTVVLATLADIDFLAALALAEASSHLQHLILDHVITITHLCRFLRKQQYVLFHDDYHLLFSDQEVVRLLRAFERLRLRHDDFLYEKVVEFLGPLISRIPLHVFENPVSLPPDFAIPHPPDRKGRPRGYYRLDSIRCDYDYTFQRSWIHRPAYVQNGGQRSQTFYRFHEESPNRYLREEFLFCKRYVSDFNTCHHVVDIMPILTVGNDNHTITLDGIANIRKASNEQGLRPMFEKRCLQASLEVILGVKFIDQQAISASSFVAILEQPGWMEMWTPSELGWWFAIGLSQYGSKPIEKYIDQCFVNKRAALMWLLLGAHYWFHESADRIEDEAASNWSICCPQVPDGLEIEYISGLVDATSPKDRIWVLQQIVRRAPEFGMCRDLGANLFNYFVVRDLRETDLMLSILLEEIIDTRLQFLFEYAVSIAIEDYRRRDAVLPMNLELSRKYADKLLRKDLSLFALLSETVPPLDQQ